MPGKTVTLKRGKRIRVGPDIVITAAGPGSKSTFNIDAPKDVKIEYEGKELDESACQEDAAAVK